jgi:HEAT repeat protein
VPVAKVTRTRVLRFLREQEISDKSRANINEIAKLFDDGSHTAIAEALELCCDMGWETPDAVRLFETELLACLAQSGWEREPEDALSYSLSHCGERVVSKLLASAKSSTEIVRWRVAKAFARLPEKASTTERTLVTLSSDPVVRVRAEACWALGMIGPLAESSLDVLKSRYESDDPIVAQKALHALANALGRLSAPCEEPAFRALFLGACRSRNEEFISSGIHGLDNVCMPCEERRSVFVELLSDQSGNVSFTWVAWSIKRHLENCDFSPLVPHLIALMERTGAENRFAVLETLQEMGSKAHAAVPFLVDMLNETQDFYVARALWSIERRADRVLPTLLKEFETHAEAIADLCCEMGPQAAPLLPLLMDALTVDYWDLQWAAADAIGYVAEENATVLPKLLDALNHESSRVRSAAARSISRVGAPALDALEVIIRADDRFKRDFALYAAGNMGSVAAPLAPLLASMLHGAGADADHELSLAVALAFISRDASAVPALMRVFEREALLSEAVRAVEALGHIGSGASEAIDLLQVIAADDDAPTELTEAARESLAKILQD